jgi:hypothetical protein
MIQTFIASLILSSVSFALPLALNTVSSILPDGSRIKVLADVTVNHDFVEFFIQKGQIFGSEYGMDQSIPSCKANFTIHHKEGECKMSEGEVFKMGPSTTVKAGNYTTSCGNSDPSLRSVSLMVSLGNGETLRLRCVRDSLTVSSAHISGSDVMEALRNQAISFIR